MAHGAAVQDTAVAVHREAAAAASAAAEAAEKSNSNDVAAAAMSSRNGTPPFVPVESQPAPRDDGRNISTTNDADHDEGKALKIVIYGAVNAMMAIPILYGYAAIIFRWCIRTDIVYIRTLREVIRRLVNAIDC